MAIQTRSKSRSLANAEVVCEGITGIKPHNQYGDRISINLLTDESSDYDMSSNEGGKSESKSSNTDQAQSDVIQYPKTFHYFSRFPKEIRAMIFSHACPSAWQISNEKRTQDTLTQLPMDLLEFPILYYVNHEAREEILRHWRRFTKLCYRPNQHHLQLSLQDWDNLEYMRSMEIFKICNEGYMDTVKEISLDALVYFPYSTQPLARNRPLQRGIFKFCQIIEGLEEISEIPTQNIFRYLPMLERVVVRAISRYYTGYSNEKSAKKEGWIRTAWKHAWGDEKKVPEISFVVIPG
ncbi:hypothetical protein NHQ30_010196 [Ciborinia camelliae]|nr:hypothetical protein NHQ30_010196 [Ciborinia camelliae]